MVGVLDPLGRVYPPPYPPPCGHPRYFSNRIRPILVDGFFSGQKMQKPRTPSRVIGVPGVAMGCCWFCLGCFGTILEDERLVGFPAKSGPSSRMDVFQAKVQKLLSILDDERLAGFLVKSGPSSRMDVFRAKVQKPSASVSISVQWRL